MAPSRKSSWSGSSRFGGAGNWDSCHSGVSGSSGIAIRCAVGASLMVVIRLWPPPMPPAGRRIAASSEVRCSTSQGGPPLPADGDHGPTLRRAGDEVPGGGEERSDQRARDERPPELLEDHGGVGQPQADARRARAASARRRRCRRARPSRRRSMTRSSPSRARMRSRGSRPASMVRIPSASSRWPSLTRKSISAPWAGRGSARPQCCAGPVRCRPRWSG